MSERIDEIESRLREMGPLPESEEASRDGDAPAEPVVAEPEAQPAAEHAEGELRIPSGYSVLAGGVDGRRTVAVVVSRFNGEITNRLLERALEELDEVGVTRDSIMVMPVPGAFELPLAAMALAKTRRYACVVALGCIIRGDTPHFDYVASEAASGLQLAALADGRAGLVRRPDRGHTRAGRGADRPRRGRRADRARDGRCLLPAPRAGCRGLALSGNALPLLLKSHGESVRNLRKEAVLRSQPEPFDGGHEAALRPEPPARPRAPRRTGHTRVRLHPLSQGGQSRKGSLGPI